MKRFLENQYLGLVKMLNFHNAFQKEILKFACDQIKR